MIEQRRYEMRTRLVLTLLTSILITVLSAGCASRAEGHPVASPTPGEVTATSQLELGGELPCVRTEEVSPLEKGASEGTGETLSPQLTFTTEQKIASVEEAEQTEESTPARPESVVEETLPEREETPTPAMEAPSETHPARPPRGLEEGAGESQTELQVEIPAPLDLPPLEPWQEEVKADYLETSAWLYQSLQPDPSQTPHYVQDVTWHSKNVTYTGSIVKGLTEGLRELQASGGGAFSQMPQRQVWVGPLRPSEPELKLVKVVDLCPQGRVVYRIDLQTWKVIEKIPLDPYAEVVWMSYDDGEGRWKMVYVERFELPPDPEERAAVVEKVLEEARNWD